jgi:hypothetical protein
MGSVPPRSSCLPAPPRPGACLTVGDLTVEAGAAGAWRAQTVRTLLAYGAEPNAQAALSGSAALHLAARSGAAPSVVHELRRHGAAVEGRNRHGQTALMLGTSMAACMHDMTEMTGSSSSSMGMVWLVLYE